MNLLLSPFLLISNLIVPFYQLDNNTEPHNNWLLEGILQKHRKIFFCLKIQERNKTIQPSNESPFKRHSGYQKPWILQKEEFTEKIIVMFMFLYFSL